MLLENPLSKRYMTRSINIEWIFVSVTNKKASDSFESDA